MGGRPGFFLMDPRDCAEKLLLGPDEIGAITRELGLGISRDYQGRELKLVGVLKGAALFMADLMRHIQVPTAIDFVGVSSYGDELSPSNPIRFTKELDEPIRGEHVLIVEDIVDTGQTLEFLLEALGRGEPASLAAVTLLDRPARRTVDIRPDYVGMIIPDCFVCGYGLDYKRRFRNLPYIFALKKELYP